MTRYTQRQLRELVADGIAIDVTKADNTKRIEIEKAENFLLQVGYAEGIYGCNGKLLQGNSTKNLYAITSRTSAIYIF